MKVRMQAELTDRSYRAVRLYIVYKAVQKLKGTIRVESVFGEDKELFISIPNHS